MEITALALHRRFPHWLWLVHIEAVLIPALMLASPWRRWLVPLVAALLLPTLVSLRSRPVSETAIRIDKSDFRLAVSDQTGPVLQITVGLGSNPAPKQRAGDGATPEGAYYICNREVLPDQHWLGLNYPNTKDALRGQGLLTWTETWLLLVQNRNGLTPYQGTALGNGIGIHRGPHFTAGSIGASVEELATLYKLVPLGSRVEIVP